MSIQVIEAYYRAFNSGDFAGMLALLAPDVVHDVNQGTREVGKDAFAEFLDRMNSSYHEQLSDLVIMGDAVGKRFAAEFTVDGVYLKADPGFPEARGQRYRLPAGAFLEVASGLITRVTTYYNLSDWLLQVSDGQWSVRPGPLLEESAEP
jgi:steroid delta-isomerase-like uncharacterized protein